MVIDKIILFENYFFFTSSCLYTKLKIINLIIKAITAKIIKKKTQELLCQTGNMKIINSNRFPSSFTSLLFSGFLPIILKKWKNLQHLKQFCDDDAKDFDTAFSKKQMKAKTVDTQRRNNAKNSCYKKSCYGKEEKAAIFARKKNK